MNQTMPEGREVALVRGLFTADDSLAAGVFVQHGNRIESRARRVKTGHAVEVVVDERNARGATVAQGIRNVVNARLKRIKPVHR